MGRIVAVDYGLARIGLAISDESLLIARTLGVIPSFKNMDQTVEAILAQFQPYQIATIVVGLPLKMNGQPGTIMPQVSQFIEVLQKKTSVQILTRDERLTTVQAERTLREACMNRKKRAKVIDAVTAMIILQNYLDYLRRPSALA